jgi:hypothetical protein
MLTQEKFGSLQWPVTCTARINLGGGGVLANNEPNKSDRTIYKGAKHAQNNFTKKEGLLQPHCGGPAGSSPFTMPVWAREGRMRHAAFTWGYAGACVLCII